MNICPGMTVPCCISKFSWLCIAGFPNFTSISITITNSSTSSSIIFDHQRFAFLWHGFYSFVYLELLASSISFRRTWIFDAIFPIFSLVNEWKPTLSMFIRSIIIGETIFILCISPAFNTKMRIDVAEVAHTICLNSLWMKELDHLPFLQYNQQL